jgi:hypothetical protein
MKEWFRDTNFRTHSLKLIGELNHVIEDYQKQGLTLTLRQLYYQCVVQNLFPNSERSYQNLSRLVTDARMAGLMDWDAIEDRARRPRVPQDFDDLDQLVDAALGSYRLPRWADQPNYVELWVEKEALAGVLAPIARRYHITLMVNKGYSSASAMYESANRYISNVKDKDGEHRSLHLLYLGDHDPSGEDMVRDVQERLELFGAPLEVDKIAITMPQVKKFKPPPNPAKISDPRADAYIAEHGNHSWEVDALPPKVLTQVITAKLEELVDHDLMDEILAQEERDKTLLRAAVASLRKKGKKK